jgi:hypothetical protein
MILRAIPARYRVISRAAETYDTVTLGLEPVDRVFSTFNVAAPGFADRPGRRR